MIFHFNIKIFGKVQGVGYRNFALKKAKSLNITGFVKNQEDGSVYIEVEGREEDLNLFLNYCHQGPKFADVKNVEIIKSYIKKYKEFIIENN